MKNYYFETDGINRPYTGSVEANPDSLPPMGALRTEPEFKEGYWPCELGGKWVQVEDHRGKVIYFTQDPRVSEGVKNVGAIKTGYTLLEPPTIWAVWNGGYWEDRPAPAPEVITKRQLKLAFIQTDGLLESVVAKVIAMPITSAVRIEWEESTEFSQQNAFIVWLVREFHLDLETLFLAANDL